MAIFAKCKIPDMFHVQVLGLGLGLGGQVLGLGLKGQVLGLGLGLAYCGLDSKSVQCCLAVYLICNDDAVLVGLIGAHVMVCKIGE